MMRSQSQSLSWAVTRFDILLKKVLSDCCWGLSGQGRVRNRSRHIRQNTVSIIQAGEDGTLVWVRSGLQWDFYFFSADKFRKGYFRMRNIIRTDRNVDFPGDLGHTVN